MWAIFKERILTAVVYLVLALSVTGLSINVYTTMQIIDMI